MTRYEAAASTSTKCSRHYQKLKDLLIPLTEINLAIGDFSKDYRIGDGGFGVVYIGRLSDRWQNHEVAIKRLDNTDHQGKKEFLNELRLISRFHHQNIISFIGYCDEGDEMILVYEYARNGSLDHHLQDRIRDTSYHGHIAFNTH
nr:probable receptor-like protein kinase At5g59700 [Tanacetum cinerariifolium]